MKDSGDHGSAVPIRERTLPEKVDWLICQVALLQTRIDELLRRQPSEVGVRKIGDV